MPRVLRVLEAVEVPPLFDLPQPPGRSGPEDAGGWLVPIAFWLCLAAAVVLYAAVALAPPFLAQEWLSALYHEQQVRLVAVEQEVEQLARISAALSNEPAYAAEWARVDFRAALPAAEMIAVEPRLHLNGAGAQTASGSVAARDFGARHAWAVVLIEPFATDVRVRRGTLAAAALLVVFAFGFVHEGHAEQARAAARGLRSAAGGLIARYRRRAG